MNNFISASCLCIVSCAIRWWRSAGLVGGMLAVVLNLELAHDPLDDPQLRTGAGCRNGPPLLLEPSLDSLEIKD